LTLQVLVLIYISNCTTRRRESMIGVLIPVPFEPETGSRGITVPVGGTPRPGVYYFSGGRTFRQMESRKEIYWEAEDDPRVVVVLVDDFKPYVAAIRGDSSCYDADAWSEHASLTIALARAARLCDGNEH
jgi:hypothetical protein